MTWCVRRRRFSTFYMPVTGGKTSTRSCAFGLERLQPYVRERNIAGMRLQTDETRIGIDAGRITPGCISRGSLEPSRFLTVESHDVVLIVHFDFEPLPSLRGEILIVLVVLLPRSGSRSLDLVDRSSAGEETTVRLAETLVSARFFIDLDFKPGMDGNECS